MRGRRDPGESDTGHVVRELQDARRQIGLLTAHIRSMLDASVHPVATIGTDGKVTDVNIAAEQATGHGRDDLIGSDFGRWFADRDLAEADCAMVFAAGLVRNRPHELRHVDGRVTPVLFNGSVYRDAAGSVLGAFAALRDATMVKEAAAALRDSEQRLRVILDNAPVGIDELTPGGDLVSANHYFCQLVGYGLDELVSRPISDVIHPDDRAADLASTERLITGELASYTMEKRFLRKDGGMVWAEVNRAIVRDQDGRPEGIVGVVRDITAQRQAEADIRELHTQLEARVEQRTADLERANKNLEAFTYSVSHDLRAPLRAMSGFAEALLEDYSDSLDAHGRGYADRIQLAAERMSALIDDLLELSRVSRAGISPGPVDLSEEVARLAEGLRTRDAGRRASFVVKAGVVVTADRVLIRSVLQNLLENSWKFTAQRDEAVIEFGTAPAGDGQICCFVGLSSVTAGTSGPRGPSVRALPSISRWRRRRMARPSNRAQCPALANRTRMISWIMTSTTVMTT